jgi:hypothetical protein
MNSFSPFEPSPFPDGTPLVVADLVGDLTFYADFRDPADVTRTPFDSVSGCAWTRDISRATVFAQAEEALRALAARRFNQTRKLRLVAAPLPPVAAPSSE